MDPLDVYRIRKLKVYRFAAYVLVGFGILSGVVGPLGVAMVKEKTDDGGNWPSVNGKVVKSEVETREEESTVMIGKRITKVTTTDYVARVLAEFEVDGKAYTTDRIHLIGKQAFSKRIPAAALLNNFPIGKEVPVYYNPENPEEAMLSKGSNIDTNPMTVVIGGICFAFVGIVIVTILSSVIGMIESKYDDEAMEIVPSTPENSDRHFSELQSAKYFKNQG
ncbi:DUF3592 domain-containing protein [Thalassoglobus sp. JC818]|uniref:DUF3592 domain-containing protein n=1 Tax=Thalassoglobus sp. JC818 TaxID=3232136 RepID=UPI00345AB83A